MTLESLKTALQELEGFARRNEERAKQATEVLRAPLVPGAKTIALIEAEARYHEAARIHLVIRERVREALS